MPTPRSYSAARAGSKAAVRRRCRACRRGARAAAAGDKGGGPARADLAALIAELTEQMHTAAAELQFEVAARIRDEIRDLKHELRGMQAAGV